MKLIEVGNYRGARRYVSWRTIGRLYSRWPVTSGRSYAEPRFARLDSVLRLRNQSTADTRHLSYGPGKIWKKTYKQKKYSQIRAVTA
jgi:hypothetical protein